MAGRRRRRAASYINVRLSEKDDPDLIQFWQACEPGQGADVVRRALRAWIDDQRQAKGPQDNDPATRADVVKVAGAIAALSGQVEALNRAIAQGLPVGVVAAQVVAAPVVPQLDDEERKARLKNVLGRKW